MRVFIALVILWFSLVAVMRVQAQELPPPESYEAPCAPTVPEDSRRALMARGNLQGVWFHADLARCMLERLQLLPAYARQVHLLEQRVTLSNERDALRQREIDLASQQVTTATGALDAAIRAQHNAEAERDAWYRAPLLWFGVGAVLAIVLIVVAGAVLHDITL